MKINPILSGAADSLAPPDTRPIYEWAAENVQLVGGKGAFFDPDAVPSQRFAFDWISNPDIRNITLVWPTGFGKSVFFEAWIAHTVAENPSDAQFSHQTDRPASQWVEKRVVPTLEACPATAPIMRTTHRHKKRKLELNLANGCTLYFGGANMRNLQDKSLPIVGGQEVWDWPANGAIAEAKARTHDRFDEKCVFCGQGGVEGSEFEGEYLGGSLFTTGYTCPGCKEETPYMPNTADPAADFESVMHWNKDMAAADQVPWERLLKTVRYVTPCCGRKMRDTPNNRRRLAMRQVLIALDDHEGIPGWVSHSVPVLAAHWVPWSKLVVQYLQARRAEMARDTSKKRAFVMKRLARFWSERPVTPVLNLDAGEPYSRSDYFPPSGEPAPRWEREAFRFMAIDVQGDHYWSIIRAWRLDGSSRLLYEGRLASMEIVRETQKRFEVSNENVGIDCGYEPERVANARWKYRKEVRRNEKVVGFSCWVMLRGDRAESFPHHEIRGRQKIKIRKVYSPALSMKTSEGTPYQVVKFSNLMAKDALAAMMAGSRPFGVFTNHSEEYGAQMQSEAKIEVSPGKWNWVKVNAKGKASDKVANHIWDCEVMGVVLSSLRGVISAGLGEESQEDEPS